MKDGYRLIGGVYNKPVSKIKAGDVDVINIGKYAWKSASAKIPGVTLHATER